MSRLSGRDRFEAAETTLVAEADLTIDILAAMAKNKEGLTAVRAEKDGQ